MSCNHGLSRSSVYLTALVLILLSGCASMSSSKEDLQSVGENEGIVVGSVLLNAEKGNPEESGLAFLTGRKAGEMEYSVSIGKPLLARMGRPRRMTWTQWLDAVHSVKAMPGKEEVFAIKLPAGSYNIGRLEADGIVSTILHRPTMKMAIHFYVKPGKTIYIGKLVVDLPHRIGDGSVARFEVLDAQQEAIEELKGKHPTIDINPEKALATTRTIRDYNLLIN
jgi:hypothetical protein